MNLNLTNNQHNIESKKYSKQREYIKRYVLFSQKFEYSEISIANQKKNN